MITSLLFLLPLMGQSGTSIDSAAVFWLEDNYPIQSLVEKTMVLIDSQGELSIAQLLERDTAFTFQSLDPDSSVFAGGQTVWLKIHIYPKIDIKDWWLVVKRDNSDYSYVAANEYVEVYYVQDGEVVDNSRTGLFVPASEKEINSPNSINRVFASFEKDQPVVIYIRIRDHNSIQTLLELRASTFPILKPDKRMFESTDAYSYITLTIGIYVFCFFFYTRDESYLLLFGLLACLFLHYQILDPYFPIIDWFFPENPILVQLAWIILTSLTFVFFLEFGRKFANIKQISPFWDKVMQVFSLVLLAALAIRVGIWFFFPSKVFSPIWTAIPIFLGGLLIVLRLAFFKDTLVRNFVFGAGWLFTFSILGVLWENNIIYFFSFINPWQVAQGGFIFIYALGLSRKIQLSERARSEVQKVKEIDAIKSKFFANISHEFRTPLSLILGPINQSLEAIPSSEELVENTEIPVKGKYLKVMKRNALRLKTLIDQILDLSKLDQREMALEMQTGDIIQFIRVIVFSFESLADRKHIRLRTHFPSTIENAVFDQDKLEKILTNLLSNAFKFTPEHGEVSVQLEDTRQELKIRIADSGVGMKAADAAQVFDRFYQVEGTYEQGSGIGLSLVKELVELHRGQISVDTVEGRGTTFKLVLPYLESSFHPHEIISLPKPLIRPSLQVEDLVVLQEEELTTQNDLCKDAPLLLIVEDNPDLRQYVADQLKPSYRILLAKNGKEGQQLAEQYLPELIISDLMMPQMNGLELCNAIKKEVKTSHIPFILLTAKADQEAKIKGLRTGADDYLTKPFDGLELVLRVKNILEQRQRWREKMAAQLPFLPTIDSGLSSMDEQFVQAVIAEIEKNIDNEYFSVEDLASAVGFSRSQLSRKLKGLSNKTPNQLIREIRLTKAQQLLEQKVATVSEIAFQVGYSNLSYFSKSYKEAFGVSPSEVR